MDILTAICSHVTTSSMPLARRLGGHHPKPTQQMVGGHPMTLTNNLHAHWIVNLSSFTFSGANGNRAGASCALAAPVARASAPIQLYLKGGQ